jgi:hypothetical protein
MPEANTSPENSNGKNDGGEVAEAPSVPLAARREMALIAASAGVRSDTVKLDIGPDSGSARISFVLETETPVEELDTDIRPEEPLVFVYADVDSIGVTAPRLVLSGREDFPRNLPHLNPVAPGAPASLCLSRTGLQPLYDRYRIESVMMRLRTWMRDAMTGGLIADGWEPVPFSAGMPTRGGLFDPAAFQEIAIERRVESGWTTGVAIITLPDKGDYVVIKPAEFDAIEPAGYSALSRAAEATVENGLRVGVPWLFIWPTDDKPLADPIFGFWTTYRDMRNGLSAIGLTEFLETAIGAVLANGCDCKHAPGRCTLVVLVGLWRPAPLAQNIYGLSDNLAARRTEIKAFTLETGLGGNLIADETKLRTVIADPMPSPALFRSTTGSPRMGPVGLVGYGALGQSVADHLLRSGIEEMNAIDADKMLAHNLARHGGVIQDLYRPKVDYLERSASAMTAAGHRPRIRVLKDDAATLSDSKLAEGLDGSRLIIDATADERVRGRLTKFNIDDRRQIVRIEIFHRGRLGVEFVTASSGNPGLFDLYYLLCREALTDTDVEAWLYDDHVNLGAQAEELLFGFGCSSRTTRLPNYVVAQHASAFMPTIVQGLTADIPPGIGINCLDPNFRPVGWRWIDVPEFLKVRPSTAPGWAVRLHPKVLDFLIDRRAAALPSETGGYLYGGWDAALKEITIVEASPLPPGSTSSAASLTMGPAGNTPLERRLATKTCGRIVLCGTWHSHPGSSAALSGRDAATVTSFTSVDRDLGVPTLLLIVAASRGFEVHLQA